MTDETNDAANGATHGPSDRELARLRARVRALEAALESRSRELRLIQKHCCPRDLNLIARIRAGLPPLTRFAFEPGLWRETTELTPAEVEPVMRELWRSLAPLELDDDGS